MNVFLWHVHGSWTTAFVQGPHRYFVPLLPDRGPDGRGRAQTWDWPASVVEVTPEEAADLDVDVVVLQRPEELRRLAAQWLRRPLPTIYLEHNAPEGSINGMRHPAADRRDLLVCHVTDFNQLFWDCGSTETAVIEHGIVDPGYQYTGELPRAGVVINDPVRRGRVVGADLLPALGAAVPVDLFGMRTESLGGRDLPQAEMHTELARRRLYVHPFRWTSLGLSLIEAMQLGMPVVALATTEVPQAVPPGTGVISNRVESLALAMRQLADDPETARIIGEKARAYATERYGLARFLTDWNALLERVAA